MGISNVVSESNEVIVIHNRSMVCLNHEISIVDLLDLRMVSMKKD